MTDVGQLAVAVLYPVTASRLDSLGTARLQLLQTLLDTPSFFVCSLAGFSRRGVVIQAGTSRSADGMRLVQAEA